MAIRELGQDWWNSGHAHVEASASDLDAVLPLFICNDGSIMHRYLVLALFTTLVGPAY